MTPTTQPEITVYGATDCDDTARSRDLLDRHGVAYRFVNIDHDPDAEAFVIQHNRGFRSTPTIAFADGSCLVEPSDAELARKLGLEL